MNWRGTGAIPLVTVQAIIKRMQSKPGYTIEEAASALSKDVAWVESRIGDGTVRPLRRSWDAGRLYLSEPMMQRLRSVPDEVEAPILAEGWLRLGEAALEAAVTPTTIVKWAVQAELHRVHERTGWRYPRDGVRARARAYCQTVRFHRATPPRWFQAEAAA